MPGPYRIVIDKNNRGTLGDPRIVIVSWCVHGVQRVIFPTGHHRVGQVSIIIVFILLLVKVND